MELVDAYKEQIAGLVAGGCHIIFIETIFDTLNARAAIFAYITFFEECGLPKLPLILSGTIIDAGGAHSLRSKHRGFLHLDDER